MEIAFETYLEEFEQLPAINAITNTIFGIDIIVGFFTSYINVSTGDEIFGFQMIGINYIVNGSFTVDLISTISIDKWYSNISEVPNESILTLLKIVGMIKLQRIRRLAKIISNLN